MGKMPVLFIGHGSPTNALVFPTPEHFYPLLTVLGAADENDPVRVFAEGSTLGAISMTSYRIG
jgi:4,5-DOPA dioxygenase extradiol